MVPPNIQRFNELAVWILGEAYAAFPGHAFLKTAELFPEPTLEQRGAFADTIDFLNREGYIVSRHVGIAGTSADATLTGRGLAVLNRIPSALAEGQTLGEQARSAATGLAKSTATDVAKEAARVVVREVFRAIMTAGS
jgi:hypothetical protein